MYNNPNLHQCYMNMTYKFHNTNEWLLLAFKTNEKVLAVAQLPK